VDTISILDYCPKPGAGAEYLLICTRLAPVTGPPDSFVIPHIIGDMPSKPTMADKARSQFMFEASTVSPVCHHVVRGLV
jgi:hypothetical protein